MLRVGINYKVSICAVIRTLLLARVQQGVRLCIFVVTRVSVLTVNVPISAVDLKDSKKVCHDKDLGIKVSA